MKEKILDEIEFIVLDSKNKIANVVSEYYFYYMGIPATPTQVEKFVHYVQAHLAKNHNVTNRKIEISELKKMIDNTTFQHNNLSLKM
ncbi:TPA: hypothetical protein NV714_003505 [Escherichia coli]|nr:hypothetical protein [Escherichia coli]